MSDKGKALSKGAKEASHSSKAVNSHVAGEMKEVIPNYLDYGRKIRAEKISNNSGFKLRPENKAIMK